MKIKWLGHAAMLITSDSGTRIITDPYEPAPSLNYGEIDESADIVTISHEHPDHNNTAGVGGSPTVVRGATEAKGISFRGIPTAHDEAGGSQRGGNTIFCFEVDGVSICHVGDLGHALDNRQVAETGKVDVLLIPVGGTYTIDAAGAAGIIAQLKPRVTIPMHCKNDRCTFLSGTMDDFTAGKGNVTRLDSSEVEIKAENLPAEPQIIVLQPSR
jgi:L-ascorbate metabolism protein UlaG (beta-lactamase superfamily)